MKRQRVLKSQWTWTCSNIIVWSFLAEIWHHRSWIAGERTFASCCFNPLSFFFSHFFTSGKAKAHSRCVCFIMMQYTKSALRLYTADDCISCNIASSLHQNLILQIMPRKWDIVQLRINKAVYRKGVGIGLIWHWKMVIVWNVITVIKIHRHGRESSTGDSHSVPNLSIICEEQQRGSKVRYDLR